MPQEGQTEAAVGGKLPSADQYVGSSVPVVCGCGWAAPLRGVRGLGCRKAPCAAKACWFGWEHSCPHPLSSDCGEGLWLSLINGKEAVNHPQPSRSGRSHCRQGKARWQRWPQVLLQAGEGGEGTRCTVMAQWDAGHGLVWHFATLHAGTAAASSLRSILVFLPSMSLPGCPQGLAAGDLSGPCSICWTTGGRAIPEIWPRLRQIHLGVWGGCELQLGMEGALGSLPAPCQRCVGWHQPEMFGGRAARSRHPPGQSRPCWVTAAFPD